MISNTLPQIERVNSNFTSTEIVTLKVGFEYRRGITLKFVQDLKNLLKFLGIFHVIFSRF